MGRLLSAAGARVSAVRVNRLFDQTFYAEIVLQGAAGEQSIDARPSDAIAIAIHMQAPIYVAADVLELAAAYDVTLREPTGASQISQRILENWRSLGYPFAHLVPSLVAQSRSRSRKRRRG